MRLLQPQARQRLAAGRLLNDACPRRVRARASTSLCPPPPAQTSAVTHLHRPEAPPATPLPPPVEWHRGACRGSYCKSWQAFAACSGPSTRHHSHSRCRRHHSSRPSWPFGDDSVESCVQRLRSLRCVLTSSDAEIDSTARPIVASPKTIARRSMRLIRPE